MDIQLDPPSGRPEDWLRTRTAEPQVRAYVDVFRLNV
jgi:hypothetical protein